VRSIKDTGIAMKADTPRRRRAPAIGLISTVTTGEQAAAGEILAQVSRCQLGFTALFCSTRHDLGRLGRALSAGGLERVIGAATGRAIGPGGFLGAGITGFHLPGDRFKVADALIEDVSEFGLPDARALVQSLLRRLRRGPASDFPHLFAMLLVDAEPRCEERLVAALGTELGGVPLVGGSAGDVYFNPRPGQDSTAARILHRGRAVRGGAVLCIIASRDPVVASSHHDFVPGRTRLVVTDADPDRRLVREIDGRNALKAYAAACGMKAIPKDAGAFAPYPLMVKVGGQYFARGVQRIYADGSVEFACAMEPGLVVTVARPVDMLQRLREGFDTLTATLGPPELVIGFDCAARTVYMEQHELTDAVRALFEKHKVVGFSTLGEQFNTIHVNNSFTCLGIAAAK
jgi:hypothetical protein